MSSHPNLAVQTNNTQDSISETELCARLGKCPRTLMYWRKAGKTPPYFRQGQQYRYLLSDIAAFEQAKSEGAQV